MPRWLLPAYLTIVLVSLVPLALAMRARATTSDQPRWHLFWDMDHQDKFKAQQGNPLFADGRAMRPPVRGAVARGDLRTDEHLWTGMVDGEPADTWPDAVLEDGRLTGDFVRHGRVQFEVHCAPCHGLAGDGDGLVHRRATELALLGSREGRTYVSGWAQPVSLHGEAIVGRSVGHIYETITHGRQNMAAYGTQIPDARDRWAIVAYVRALQASRAYDADEVRAAADPDEWATIEAQLESGGGDGTDGEGGDQ